jgi:hypothetical protein
MSPLHSACDNCRTISPTSAASGCCSEAHAYGVKGSRVESADGLAPTLEAAFFPEVGASRHRAGGLLGEHAGPGQRAGDA